MDQLLLTERQTQTPKRSAPSSDVSVAIATCDRPRGLARCLGALLAGRTLPAEIVVVDQSYDDSTAQIVRNAQTQATSIVYIHQRARGLSASRNAAVAAATRPILAVTDDDCVPDGEWVAVIEQTFDAVDAPDAVTGRVLPLAGNGSRRYSISARAYTRRLNFHGKHIPWHVGTGGNFAIKREWFERVGLYDERLGAGSPGHAAEDADLIYRLLRSGAHIRFEPDALIYHERQDKNRRLSSRFGYGYGIGALCSLWLRRRDGYALRMFFSWIQGTTRELIHAALCREWFEVHQRVLGLGGALQGLLYGMRVADN